MPHLNYKKLADWVNQEFIRLDITDVVAYKANKTGFSSEQIEGGACLMRIYFKSTNEKIIDNGHNYFMCFYSLKEINNEINKGYEMYIGFRYRSSKMSYYDLEIKLRKKTKNNG